jgi:ribosomal protein L30/L7E
MITLARQIQLKIKKFDEVMIELKIKYLNDKVVYPDIHKLDEKIQEISKLVDNHKQ